MAHFGNGKLSSMVFAKTFSSMNITYVFRKSFTCILIVPRFTNSSTCHKQQSNDMNSDDDNATVANFLSVAFLSRFVLALTIQT